MVYLPPSNTVGARRDALAELDHLRSTFPADCVEIFAGDWNAHAGMDHCGDHIHAGPYSLSTPTTMGGRVHRSWLYSTQLCMVDSFRPCSRQTTWRHNNGNFYELDFFLDSQSIRRQFQSVTTLSSGISDHWGKKVTLHIPSSADAASRRADRKQRFLRFQRCQQMQHRVGQLQLQAMRGPSEEAGRKRCLFRHRVEEQLENLGIHSSLESYNSWNLVSSMLLFTRMVLSGNEVVLILAGVYILPWVIALKRIVLPYP